MIDKNILNEIKKNFRQTMNADLSNSMREHGLNYKINFGVPSPRIKIIAEKFEKNAELAQYLWNEDVRESKMLASYLYPEEIFTKETAIKWIEEIKYPETADQLCMNLLSKTDYALDLSFELINNEKDIIRYTGYRLINRLLMKNAGLSSEKLNLLLYNLSKDTLSENTWLSLSAVNLLEKCFECENYKILITDFFSDWQNSNNGRKAALYDMIVFWGN
ncbi:MAG: DNA alkylation repair protein [Bacteroidales bacterium]|nr:DNA alkylation repair protein [Bacteroidales bacterium]